MHFTVCYKVNELSFYFSKNFLTTGTCTLLFWTQQWLASIDGCVPFWPLSSDLLSNACYVKKTESRVAICSQLNWTVWYFGDVLVIPRVASCCGLVI